jgi:tetratricopeptide (TPR) repeat protein
VTRPARRARSTPRRVWWPQLILAAAVVVVYANSLSGPLIFDDRAAIVDNATIEDLGSARVLAPPHETSVAGRPVANVTFAVNYAAGGRAVGGYHAVNIAIHLFCALAILGIAGRSRMPAGGALAVALIWSVHPLGTEPVDYLTQRTESLMALFYLLTLYCAVRAADTPARRGAWTIAAVTACALGMGTKETMVTAPLIVFLYDRVYLYPSVRDAARQRAPLYAGLAATWLLLAALIWSGPRSLSAGFTAHDANGLRYLLNQAVMIVRYLRLAIWPRDLVLYYGWPVPLTVAAVLPQLAAVSALLALTIWALWRAPRVGFLGAFFFLTLAPTSSFVPIATEVGAERRMYLPLIAVVALAVVAFRAIVASPRLQTAALAVTTAALAAGTIARNVEYRSSLRLAETTAERWPTPASKSMFGTELAAAGRLPDAEEQLRAAAADYPPARYYLGTVLAAEGRPGEAIDVFRSYIAAESPELEQVRLAHVELAGALVKSGRDDDAVAEYRTLLAAYPGDTESLVQLSQILLRLRRFEEAIVPLRRLTVERPADPWAFGGLGIAFASSGRVGDAIEAFQRQVALDPQNEHARQNLARAMSMRHP